jgi:aryl-alcohol dehydrogenase-like predicted oxidoreductase
MRTRQLGQHGPMVSVIGFGAMVLSPGIYDRVDDDESLATLRAVLDAGINLIDTADIYGDGHNERLVGRALAGRRDQVVLATKFGGNTDASGELVPGLGRPDHVRRAAEASLRRLDTDYIDLYYQHRVDPTTPIEDTVGALAELVTAGKVGHIGLSEAGPANIRRAHAVHPVTAVETEYSLFAREPEERVLPVTAELGIGFVAYSPLGRGFLGGRLRRLEDLAADDWRRTNPRFQGENFVRNVELADAVRALAEAKGLSPAQLALAWLASRGAVPIPGSRSPVNVADNAAAGDVQLSGEDLTRLEAIVPAGAAAGDRAGEAYLAATDA